MSSLISPGNKCVTLSKTFTPGGDRQIPIGYHSGDAHRITDRPPLRKAGSFEYVHELPGGELRFNFVFDHLTNSAGYKAVQYVSAHKCRLWMDVRLFSRHGPSTKW